MTNDEYIKEYNEAVQEMIRQHELWLQHMRDLTCCCEGPCIFSADYAPEDDCFSPTEEDGSTIVI